MDTKKYYLQQKTRRRSAAGNGQLLNYLKESTKKLSPAPYLQPYNYLIDLLVGKLYSAFVKYLDFNSIFS